MMEEYCQPVESNENNARLCMIFDVDGTLIAEGDGINHIIIRPGAVDFLKWALEERGHTLALWTAATSGWADRVATKLCRALQDEHEDCPKTFAFVWTGEKMRMQKKITQADDGCMWCECYSKRCKRCCCILGAIPYCPCRYIKDLGKVWHLDEFKFERESTLIVENTPQQCIRNYGNAIYVPTYRGSQIGEDKDMFQRMKRLVQELEQARDVRFVKKCDHRQGPHGCFEQLWWRYPLEEPPPKQNQQEEDVPYSLVIGDVM
jgi:hypothetical protein